MNNDDFGARAREHRSSGAVLKVKVSNIRSRNRSAVIAIVEGVTDVGVYEVWARRIDQNLTVEFAPAAGKSQVLDFRRRMQGDQSGLAIGIYMFVDRDFDGLRGQEEGDDIFCTEAYSIENYLVSDTILRSVLTDEFQCTAETDHRESIIELFSKVLLQYNECIAEANRRIFCGRQLGLRGNNIDNRIAKYLDICVSGVRQIYDEEKLADLIPFEREPTAEEFGNFDVEFKTLDPGLSYRGKFLLAFFKAWLNQLANEGRRPGQTLFPSTAKSGFSAGSLTLRSLAARSILPYGLEEFVENMKDPVAQSVA